LVDLKVDQLGEYVVGVFYEVYDAPTDECIAGINVTVLCGSRFDITIDEALDKAVERANLILRTIGKLELPARQREDRHG
jgi:hypothetical protein